MSLPPAEVEQVEVTCASLLLPDALLLCCCPRGDDLICHLTVPDARPSPAVLALAAFTPAA